MITLRRINSSAFYHVIFNCICSSFSDFCPCKIHTAHPGHCGKWDKFHIFIRKTSFPDSKLFFCQNYNTSSFRRFICQGRQLCCIRQFLFRSSIYRNKGICTTVSQSNRSCLIPHQNIYITCRFNGSSTHCQHISLVQTAHTCNADCRKQRTNGCRCQADQQCNKGRNGCRIRYSCLLCREHRVCIKGHGYHNKYDGQCNKKNLQCNLIRCLLTICSFYHGNHLVHKGFPCFTGNSHNNPVRQHSGSACYGTPVSATLTNYRCRLTGNCTFIHRCSTIHNFSITWNLFPCLYQNQISFFKACGRNNCNPFFLIR